MSTAKFIVYTIYRESNTFYFLKNLNEFKSYSTLEDAKQELKKIAKDFNDAKFFNNDESFITKTDCWFIKEKEIF